MHDALAQDDRKSISRRTALRTINRQSSDLLEIAETVSSLKLQQNAPPAEISAAGQLVIATKQRTEHLGRRPKQRDPDAADVIVNATLRPQVHGRWTSGEARSIWEC